MVRHAFKKYYNVNTVVFDICLNQAFVNIKSYESLNLRRRDRFEEKKNG